MKLNIECGIISIKMKHHTKYESYLPKCYIHITNDVIAISMPAALRVNDMNTAITRITNHDVIAIYMPGDLRVDDMDTAIIRITHHEVIAISMPAAFRVYDM